MQTKGILLNYEGTVDTNGQHWGAILWHKFHKYITGLEKPAFTGAYTYAETVLVTEKIIQPNHVFFDVLVHKITQQFHYLTKQGYQLDYTDVYAIATECNDLALRTLRKTKSILERLSHTFPIVLVANFYGNLDTVLTEFNIKQYFTDIIETDGASMKFPTEGYQKGINRLGYLPEECVAVGDSYHLDILPSKAAGCKVVWLNVMGWEEWGIDELEISDAEIGDIDQLPGILETWNAQPGSTLHSQLAVQ
ncbi:HAD family hydrolase [Parapedobacter lycopersici]|uniref:HAD family hydrolase n=1 Tax=Parapedobacter lycopersici TaxID=1864939 RepID=UPI00214D6EEF|nr:HAD family hydrolase [Parapedobacter lycopersici]